MKMKIFIAFITGLLFSNCTNDNVNTDTVVTLTQNEINDLKFLREEEKLARDVYIYSYNKYKLAIFNSISQSEQTHMNSVLSLLNKYGIPDPSSVQMGIFVNQDLQVLYNNLISQSNISLIEALKVGATIEDLDINDIDDFIINTSKSDLLTVYNNLTCGSKNHIRSFTTELSNNEASYEPQFISSEEYNSIINTPSGGCGNN
ncbi:DUF2202 domain-containing protein [Flavobacterium granuli]|uniref:DUF2202 domain-containing protein n=1 Tax=Flavobacterium granuli TaxID=280093 RepID=A0A1M5QAV4_9FLAO|nr:DUF2202 domain-containing protein [Flavobacterium granuli]PRZ22141.1 hypothetical protein BC624_107142 [Flavobacterium granuli]SHH11016.1 hypothetical protein SAMN05443373_107142 [Flavobacterium granuli]